MFDPSGIPLKEMQLIILYKNKITYKQKKLLSSSRSHGFLFLQLNMFLSFEQTTQSISIYTFSCLIPQPYLYSHIYIC